jgi:hypothetical protein
VENGWGYWTLVVLVLIGSICSIFPRPSLRLDAFHVKVTPPDDVYRGLFALGTAEVLVQGGEIQLALTAIQHRRFMGKDQFRLRRCRVLAQKSEIEIQTFIHRAGQFADHYVHLVDLAGIGLFGAIEDDLQQAFDDALFMHIVNRAQGVRSRE